VADLQPRKSRSGDEDDPQALADNALPATNEKEGVNVAVYFYSSTRIAHNENAITWQCIVVYQVYTNLLATNASDAFSNPVGQINEKEKYGGLSAYPSSAKVH